MPIVPPCTTLGRQCRELRATLRIAELMEDGPPFHDAIGTWLMGHTERISFGRPYVAGDRLLVDATIHVPCKYLEPELDGRGGQRAGEGASAQCLAHGFRGPVPDPAEPRHREPLQHVAEQFTVIQNRRVQRLTLPRAQRSRVLPTLDAPNPCAGAPCRTADHQTGAACCRDLVIDVVLPQDATYQEALLRTRTPPYLCKVSRAEDGVVECEVISACGYLGEDGVDCSLHGRTRPDGSPAKPSVCTEWPDLEPGDTGHPGCRLIGSRAWCAGSRRTATRRLPTHDARIPAS